MAIPCGVLEGQRSLVKNHNIDLKAFDQSIIKLPYTFVQFISELNQRAY